MQIKVSFPDRTRTSQKIEPRIPPRCRTGFQQYTVAPGDTMSGIAQRFNITAEFLVIENPHIPDPDIIFPGDVLCVPGQVTPPGGGRVPESCPEGFDRYTVVTGDTTDSLAQRLGVDSGLLVANNPHIPDPALLFPGDELCVPVPLAFPCCAVLTRSSEAVPADAAGTVLAQRLASGSHVFFITAVNLPDPSVFGAFDSYEGFVGIPGIGGFGLALSLAAEQPPVWASGLQIKPLLASGDQVYVLPGNTSTGQTGQPVLQGGLDACRA